LRQNIKFSRVPDSRKGLCSNVLQRPFLPQERLSTPGLLTSPQEGGLWVLVGLDPESSLEKEGASPEDAGRILVQ
jgi:hypothetical protein